ncbi:hypothetical protein OG338_24530 [Streptomyces sp. NBC_00726]|uniref:hypothetical protein n=1 Tax=Streptomyces sp. NBC_00726 TaxID=2903674 RepID=UPI00386CA597
MIDDLDEYARARGIKHDVQRTGPAEHVHQVRWTASGDEQNPRQSLFPSLQAPSKHTWPQVRVLPSHIGTKADAG